MFVEKFQILLGEKMHVGKIFFLSINRCVDMLIRATKSGLVSGCSTNTHRDITH